MRYLIKVGFQHYSSKLLPVIEKGSISHDAFDALALELFALQVEHNAAYRMLCRGRSKPQSWQEIPVVPTVAFKEMELTSIPPAERLKEFHSSGTTGQKPSRHFHSAESLRVYEASLGPPLREHFLADGLSLVSLTPSPKHAPESSLVHMFATVKPMFVGREDWSVDVDAVIGALGGVRKRQGAAAVQDASRNPKVLACGSPRVMGTAFNYVHLIDALCGEQLELPAGSRVLETGGYKGRSREVSREELHGMIRHALGVSDIVTEYGMCELSSQAYAHEDGIFQFPPWARVQIVSPENGREVKDGETGLVRVFDLANVWSVMAVQTEDLAVRRGHGFELLGRARGVEARGCSLMSE